MEAEREKVKMVWERIWAQALEGDRGGKTTRSQHLRQVINKALGLPSLDRVIMRVLKKEIKDFRQVRMLEAGCGSGTTSLEAAKAGAKVVLLDISSSALKVARNNFALAQQGAYFVQGSIFSLPFKTEAFEVVWNVGVLEHFVFEDQLLALKEMHHVCRAGGTVLTLNPSAKAYIYKISKWYAQKTEQWDLGYEQPVKSLKSHIASLPMGEFQREYSRGFLLQFKHLWFFFSFSKLLAGVFSLAVELTDRFLPFINYLPGFLLVSVSRKK